MPADRRRSTVAKFKAGGRQTMVNHIGGGRGGSGGDGHGNGAGGSGGHGMGPSLRFDISVGHLTMHNNVHGTDDSEAGRHHNQIAAGRGLLPDSYPGAYIHQNIHQHGARGIDMLHRTVALEAIHNSAESYPQPRCHPETRTRMLEDLRDWALAPDPETTVLWLYGPAGAGKSAIMQTLAGQLNDAGILGSSFFFKRGHVMQGNAKTLFTTIAYQLALSVPSLRTHISQIVESNPSIVALSIEVQMRSLICEPCRFNRNHDPIIILIDGLDECEGHNIQVEILRIIGQSSYQYPNSLRFIIASRPEPHIREMFDSPFYSGHHRPFNVEQSFHDVHRYLSDEFARIHREHDTMARIPLPWPPADVLEKLVRKSSGHFIYASTIIKFIDNKNHRPTQRLALVQDVNHAGSESAFDALDQLYMTILNSAARQSELTPILCAIVHLNLAADQIDKLLALEEGETRLLLRGLHSVLSVGANEDDIRSHHASFLDFLENPDRSGSFCVNTLNRQISLARSFLQFCAGPFQDHHVCGPSVLIVFITSLPSSSAVAELFPLLGSINPDYIFDPESEQYLAEHDYFTDIISWLKNTPSAPAHVIQLWEDYAFMFSINAMDRYENIALSVKQLVSPSPELVRILVSIGLLCHRLFEIPTKLDLTWTDLRTTLCSLRPKFCWK
ncbi:putative nwd2 protein [Mycena sanguinolenta]|uniref:Putative nwd2 protein n=1 Tax=Mycena sanguinolenta TaxID=230812 RepID=A0A8H6U4X5_9AGAR|nr:putative nwd2 protein [Mycena sanguinolenta]